MRYNAYQRAQVGIIINIMLCHALSCFVMRYDAYKRAQVGMIIITISIITIIIILITILCYELSMKTCHALRRIQAGTGHHHHHALSCFVMHYDAYNRLHVGIILRLQLMMALVVLIVLIVLI